MEEKQLHILTTREFWQLTPEEKNTLRGWFENEDEYNNLKSLFLGVNRLKNEFIGAENPTSKVQLDRLFTEVYSNKASGGFKDFLYQRGKMFYMQPVFQIGLAASVIVGLFLYNGNSSTTNQTASTEQPTKKFNTRKTTAPKVSSIPDVKPTIIQPTTPTLVAAVAEEKIENYDTPSVAGDISDRFENSLAENSTMEDANNFAPIAAADEEKPTADQSLTLAGTSTVVATGSTYTISPSSSVAYTFSTTAAANVADKSGRKNAKSLEEKEYDKKDLPIAIPSAAERPEILDGLFTTF